jgi:hypothetical protein
LLAFRPSRGPAPITLARCSCPDFTDGTVNQKFGSANPPGVSIEFFFSHDLQGSPFVQQANHHQILRNVGIEPVEYPYYDPKTIGLDYTGFINALQTAPVRSIFLLHACAHNPTGVDPTQDQWKAIADVMISKKHYAFFDCAYQGFATGDLDQDAWAVRYFVGRGVPLLVCQVC